MLRKMVDSGLQKFVSLIQSLFGEQDRATINEATDLTSLKEWSSLQIMIIVSEIDSEYNVILGPDDIKKAVNVRELFKIVQTKFD